MSARPFIARAMAEELPAIRPEAVPAAVLDKARLCLVDYLSSAYEASALPWSRQALSFVEPRRQGAATIALGGLAAAGDAAFANAVTAHGLVREDMHVGSISHLGIVVWPALLADLARSEEAVDGARLLAAAIAGYEAGAGLGKVLMNAELARLFRPTGLVGPLAATAALCHFRRLSVEQTAAAITLAVNCAAGLNQWPVSGGSEMYFQAGVAARNGLVCADLAASGAVTSPDAIEGEAGLFRAFARREPVRPAPMFANGNFEISSVFHKQAPACNFAQTPSQAALAARQKFGGDVARISAIEVRATQAALLYPGCDATGPFATMLAAKMSIQFGVAAAVARGTIAADNYSDLADAQILRLAGLVRLTADPALTAAYPARQPAEVTLLRDDGAEFTAALDDVLPATPGMVWQRCREAASARLGAEQAGELLDFIHALTGLADARPLNALQVPRISD